MTELITIASGNLTARINPLGAELWSLTDAQGREYMTDADPAFWTGHAPLLFPIVGALNGGAYRLGGETYSLPKHGFARTSTFALVEATAQSALFRLSQTDATLAVFPFQFDLDISFRVDDWTLETVAMVVNNSADSMPFSFGFHPAFAWPLPGGAPKDAHRVTFAEAEPQAIRRIDPPSGLLLPEPEPTLVEGRTLAPAAALFEADALIWDQLGSRALTFGAPDGARLDIAFPHLTMLGIWQKPGANYLCIEPWQGIADPEGYAGDFREKPGVIELAAGERRDFYMDVTVRPR
jgi:galactose mutarotase-like enzyme